MSDLTFITNEQDETLLDRFRVLIKDTRLFDVLVGYFYTSGFHTLHKSLEPTEKIRILIGISTDVQTFDLIKEAQAEEQQVLKFSHAQTKELFESRVAGEFEICDDNRDVEDGVAKFIDWLKSGKLEIRAYPSQKIHSKLYVMTFTEEDRDKGRVITGSSNFSKAGLIDNLEFNVELKTRADYDFALSKFNQLWLDAVDVSEKYVETIRSKTWLDDTITPYELYLKFLYEYFKDDLNRVDEVFYKYTPENFKKFEYQEDAVLNAKKILEEYGGVFIADVVGLGKTYVSALLAAQLDGRNLVIAPPFLLDEENPGSWKNVFKHFNIPATYRSIGKLEDLLKEDLEQYKNVFIDEAHRFRTESNVTYEMLAQICRGKRVILVTATPYNNRPNDILSQIKLFQSAKKSTVPNMADLEHFFTTLDSRLNGIDRQKDHEAYIRIVRENAKEIREKVLKYLMVRRTRAEIEKYYAEDLKEQGLKFPEVANPKPFLYILNEEESEVFNYTIERIVKDFSYARYMPMLYYQGEVAQLEETAQRNMGKFMKILLVKRLESSFFAFESSVDRFIRSYEQFIGQFNNGKVYISKRYSAKIYDLLESDDDKAIQEFIDKEKATAYDAKDFTPEFLDNLKNDLAILKEIRKRWSKVERDPKLETLLDKLSKEDVLKENKVIIFTESKETAEYLLAGLEGKYPGQILLFTGGSGASVKEQVIDNFDGRARRPKDDFRILVSTEVLAEGVNLDRAAVVINYDIPWNPTRMIQRVGRINRVDTKFDTIHTFNFFPTEQSNDEIKLKELAEAKIEAFISMLGTDAKLLTEGETVESHEIFNRLGSKLTITGEDESDESELKYLKFIKDLRESDTQLLERIKRLPKKARTARSAEEVRSGLITYFRKGKLQKFYFCDQGGDSKELDFISAAKLLETGPKTERAKIPAAYYELLEENKRAFLYATEEEEPTLVLRGGRDSATKLVKSIKALERFGGFTDEQEDYLKLVKSRLEEGSLPKQTMKTALKEFTAEAKTGMSQFRLLAALQKNIPSALLKEHMSRGAAQTAGPREVILSEYLVGE